MVLDAQAFRGLLEEVRAGKEEAAALLVRSYEPELRRAVRVRLTDPGLRRVLDSADVCQSVLANFFVRVMAGEFDLEQPEQLLHLLIRMARNKVLDKARHQQAGKRDQRRLDAGPATLEHVASAAADPARVVLGRDLLAAVSRLLTDEERYLAEQRGRSREWADIAQELQAQPDALRKKLSRALDRVMAELGLEEDSDA